MGNRNRFRNADPRRLTAKYRGTCQCCKKPIGVGEDITYYPLTKAVNHYSCDKVGFQQSMEAIFDEDVLGVR